MGSPVDYPASLADFERDGQEIADLSQLPPESTRTRSNKLTRTLLISATIPRSARNTSVPFEWHCYRILPLAASNEISNKKALLPEYRLQGPFLLRRPV